MFGKIFDQIYDSSIAEDWTVRMVFQDFIVLADINGVVDKTREAIARRTNVPMEIVCKAITVLEQPDPTSRTAAEDGARLRRLDEHRDWGWQVINYQKYRDVRSEIDRRRLRLTDNYDNYGGYVYFACLVGDEEKVKIGFSTNPWARIKELSTGAPLGVLFLGSIKGGKDTETTWHERFSSSRLNGEWFSKTPELEQAIVAVMDPSLRKVVTRSYSSPKQKQKQKQKQKEEGEEAAPALFKEVEAPSWEEFWAYCNMGHGPGAEWYARDKWYAADQDNWKGKSNWKSYAQRCRSWWESDGSPMVKPPTKGSAGQSAPAYIRAKLLEDEISKHPANHQSKAHNPNCTEAQKAALVALRSKFTEAKRESING